MLRSVTNSATAGFLCLVSVMPEYQLKGTEPTPVKTQTAAKLQTPDFQSIFDGETLNGWEATPPGSDDAWQVANGIIIGTGGKTRGYLTYAGNKQLSNLELKFSYRFPGKGNSGVNIRAIPDPTKKRSFQAYHADLGHVGIGKQILGAWDFHTPGRTEHRCFRGDRLVIDADDRPHITPIQDGLLNEHMNRGQWNKVHIIVNDNHFSLYINGKLASEFTENLPIKKRLQRGMLQLQLHDPHMVVQFKDIVLKVLD